MRNDILFVMIGGMPKKEVAFAWKKFLKPRSRHCYFVLHPQHLDNVDSIKKEWVPYFYPGRFFIVDRDHHVRTDWGAAISLGFATLLAMQYAFKCAQSITKYKKIVFLQQCAPLYPFHVIQREFCKDNLSYFKARTEENFNIAAYSQPFDFNRDDDELPNNPGINDFNWYSAIFALDVNHVHIFFRDHKTYIKKGEFTCVHNPVDNIESLYAEFDTLFSATKGRWHWADKVDNEAFDKSCHNADETFFAIHFKAAFTPEEFDKNVRFLPEKPDFSRRLIQPKQMIHYVFQGWQKQLQLFYESTQETNYPDVDSFGYDILKDKYLENVVIYLPRVVLFRNLLPQHTNAIAYVGTDATFNPEGLEQIYRIFQENGRLSVRHKGKTVPFSHIQKKYPNGYINPEDNAFFIVPDGTSEIRNKPTQMITYHDWTSISLSPSVLFRKMQVKGEKKIMFCSRWGRIKEIPAKTPETNIIDLLHMPAALANLKIDESTKTNWQLLELKSFDEYVRVNGTHFYTPIEPSLDELLEDTNTEEFHEFCFNTTSCLETSEQRPFFHPVEYFTTTARHIANSLNLIIKSQTLLCGQKASARMYRAESNDIIGADWADGEYGKGDMKSFFRLCRFVYTVALKSLGTHVHWYGNGSCVLDSIGENVKIGSPLTSRILSTALTSGAMFIRKCNNGGIEHYIDDLMSQKRYITDMNTSSNKKLDRYNPEAVFMPRMFTSK